ncbi:MAG: hypothetical protein CMC14_03230 [Flavobacteriaceae bacterium]|nr:hypothetical protein [Flavobacteriaceae bacterium]
MSCQESIPETIVEEGAGLLNNNTNLSGLLNRVALNDGSQDNILDRANNISILLPVTVTVNGIVITIETVNDYQLVENAIEAFSNDDDVVNISFPITIILPDFTQVTIVNQTEFDSYVSQSTNENEIDDDIECIDFVFPITLEVLEVNASIATTLVINNNEGLFELVNNLDLYTSVQLNFPITLITFDEIEIEAENLDALESTIENYIDSCDEDDDFDFNDDDQEVLLDFLTNGNWIIDEFVIVDVGQTDNFTGYVFTFLNDGTVNASNGSQNVSGTFSIEDSNPNDLLVILDFGSVIPFNDLNNPWNITESEFGTLALEIGSEANGDLEILVFEKL